MERRRLGMAHHGKNTGAGVREREVLISECAAIDAVPTGAIVCIKTGIFRADHEI